MLRVVAESITLTQAVAALESTPLWQTISVGGIVTAILGVIARRVVKAFDGIVAKVERYEIIGADHARDDDRRFASIEDRASTRHEAQMAAFRKHADQVQAVTTDLSIRVAVVEGIIERRSKDKTPPV